MFGRLTLTLDEITAGLNDTEKNQLKTARVSNQPLSQSLADAVSHQMLAWALARGATHYCHWFQPLTGGTAEKHDSFLEYQKSQVVFQFHGSSLIKGEADASSLPSGCSRSTFEARGYTVWDPASPVFIREDSGIKVLCIPTAYCSYSGTALDEKTPLLRSNKVVSEQAVRVLRLMGDDVSSVTSLVGPEQEYFLIDDEDFYKREDLVQCGRTLFGAPPAKSQQLQDQYYGSIRPRVLGFMADLNDSLMKLGVPAKTQHNEVAPAQHELAVLYGSSAEAIEWNLLVMDAMRRSAEKAGLRCLLHEKPFARINGSGKHVNWSLQTNGGENLFAPGKQPGKNTRFLLFYASVLAAVDRYHELLRFSVLTPGNAERLGGHEAPPCILSVYTGDQLEGVLDRIRSAARSVQQSPVLSPKLELNGLPHISMDSSDRNRTSPFAFTGNKFEFRAPGSSQNASFCVTVLNTAMAQILKEVADELQTSENKTLQVEKIIAKLVTDHERIIFNGNGYSVEWHQEAKKRGLVLTDQEALDGIIGENSVKMFESLGVMTREELEIRKQVTEQQHVSTAEIEGSCAVNMMRTLFEPVCIEYLQNLCTRNKCLTENGLSFVKKTVDEYAELVQHLLLMRDSLGDSLTFLKKQETFANSKRVQDLVTAARAIVDALESATEKSKWPVPSYTQILFYK